VSDTAGSGGDGPTRWGFLGAGFIAARALAPAVHAASGARLQAVAARDPARARMLEPERVHATYADLLEDDEVDAVYVALTNEQHLPWTLRALAAGKDVLCEKPLGLDAGEVGRMRAAAADAGRLLVEATWYRWHPRTRRAEELVTAGALGPVGAVECRFTFGGVPAANYRLDPARGGGAWYDVGCYLANAATWVLPRAEPATVSAQARRGPSGVDLAVDATVTFDTGATAGLHAGIDDVEAQRLAVTGTTGRLVLTGPEVFTSWHRPSSLEWSDGTHRVEEFGPVDPYRLMVEAFGRRRLGDEDAWLPPDDESGRTAALMDVVAAAWAGR
jgi:D-xylose 1-dehydrogenase (NADP+, D-xylono-1,5-lactone-forming)